jgi:predicted phage tail protein
MLIEVMLYGFLGKRFGKEHRFNIDSPAEALRALMANFPDFEECLRAYPFGFRVLRGEEAITEEELFLIGDARPVKIVPVIQGAGQFGRIIGGVVLVVVGALLAFTGVGSFLGAYAASVGVGLMVGGAMTVIGGIIELAMAPSPQDKTGQAVNRRSYDFDGPVNTAKAGYPVPVGYGRLLVGGAVVSSGIKVKTTYSG